MQHLPKSIDCSPTNTDLEDEAYNGRIGGDEQTHFPQFRMNEKADSILVRYVSGLDEVKNVVGNVAQLEETTQDIKFRFTGEDGASRWRSYSICKSMLETLQRM